MAAATAALTTIAAATSAHRRGRRSAGALAASPERDSAIHCSSPAMSRALCQRSSRSLARHFWMTCSSAAGASGCTLLTGFGSPPTIAAMRLVLFFPSKARRPVTISYSTAPNAKMSLRGSTSAPSSCSGDMY